MPTLPKKINPTAVPVLTERVDADRINIPTLTEIHTEKIEHLSDAQCQQLAKQIAPQLEKLVRAKLTQNFEAQLEEALLDIQTMLPDLIRATMKSQQPL